MALGFEQMRPGSLGTNWPDREPPLVPWNQLTHEIEGGTTAKGPSAARMFGNAGKEYLKKHGGSFEHLAKIGEHLSSH
jgi:sterol carrier protein 2